MSNIADKIRKLLALAGNNPNEAEADQAYTMAKTLMLKHGIEQDRLGEKPQVGFGSTLDLGSKYQEYLRNASAVLANTRYVYYSDGTFKFVGRAHHVEFAELLFAHLSLQVEELYKSSLPKGLTQKQRSAFRKGFKVSCAHRVWERCFEMDRLVQSAKSGGTALVIHSTQLASEIDDFLNSLGNVRKAKSKGRSIKVDPIAAARGRTAGNQVEINREMN